MVRVGLEQRGGAAGRGLRVLWRGKILIVATGLLFALAALLAAQLAAPVYRAEARIRLLAPGRADVSSPAAVAASPEFLAALAERLDPALRRPPTPSSFGGELLRIVGGQATAERSGLAGWLRESLTVAGDSETGLVAVAFESGDAATAGDVANAAAAELAEAEWLSPPRSASMVSQAVAGASADDLGNLIRSSEERLQAAERRLEVLERGLAGASGETGPTPAQLDALADALARTAEQRAGLEETARRLGDPSAVAGENEANAEWTALSRLEAERARLSNDVEAMARTLADDHPRVTTIRLRLTDLDREIAAEADRIRATLLPEIETLRGRETALAQDLARLREDETRTAGNRRERDAFRREIADETDRLDALRRRQAALRTAAPPSPPETPDAAPSPATIVSEAAVPSEPIFPKVLPVTVGAGLAGCLAATAGLLLSFLAGSARPEARERVRAASAFDARTPSAAAVRPVPETPSGTGLVIEGVESISLDEVLGALAFSDVSRALIVSPAEPMLKRTSLDLARRLALRSYAVVLIDLSPDQTAAGSVGITGEPAGLLDLVADRASYADIVRRDFATAADVVPLGRGDLPRAMQSGEAMRNVLDFIERTYECMLVDCARLPASDVATLMDEDAALLVAIDGSPAEAVGALVRELAGAGLEDFILVSDGRVRAPSSGSRTSPG